MQPVPPRGWCVQIFDVTPSRAATTTAALRSAMPEAQLTADDDGSSLVVETPDLPDALEQVLAVVVAADPDAVRAHVARVDPALLTR